MFAGKARAYLNEAPLRCSTSGRLVGSPTNIRLGWKGLPGANILAYYENPLIAVVKSFIVQTPVVCIRKLFTAIINAEIW